jgi:hypothetical protein
MTIYEYKSRCEWLAKFYAEAAETGRAMQFHNGDWVDYERGPNMESIPDKWRIKPEPQKAWVVWGPGGPTTILGASYAEQYARECGGTIQEITRPEPQ